MTVVIGNLFEGILVSKGKSYVVEGILGRMPNVNLFYDIIESLESMGIWEKVKTCFLRRKLDSVEMVCMTS